MVAPNGNVFVFILLLPTVTCGGPGSFTLRWSPDDRAGDGCEHPRTTLDALCFDGELYELDGDLFGRRLGRSSLYCAPAVTITEDRLEETDYICTQQFDTFYGTFVMELTFQPSCSTLAPFPDEGIAGKDSYWTVIRSKLFPHGTKKFDGVTVGKVEFGTGMVLSEDWIIKHDVFYGIVLDAKDYDVGMCSGKCGGKSDYNCWCDEQCSSRGDCCNDACDSCYIACEDVVLPDCTNQHICDTIVDKVNCQPLGHRHFIIGDTCHSAETCGIYCVLGYASGIIECTKNGMECRGGRCACNPDTPCFGASSLVTIMEPEGGARKQIRMDGLNIGDNVMSFDESGNVMFDEVHYLFDHTSDTLSEEGNFSLFRISHNNGSLAVTEEHLIYLTKRKGSHSDYCLKFDDGEVCTYVAGSITTDDFIWINDGLKMVPRQVVHVSTEKGFIRSPITWTGNIIADNVAASVYHKVHSKK